jgi:UDP-glucose 4-epimerase
VHVNDVINAVLSFVDYQGPNFDVYNISTRDSLNVNDIADLTFKALGLNKSDINITFTGGDRGWKADVPIVKLDPSKIESTGWRPRFTSQEAMLDALVAMRQEIL